MSTIYIPPGGSGRSEAPAHVRGALTAGSEVYRHEGTLPYRMDPIAAAAAVRGTGHAMLLGAASAAPLLAFGELAACVRHGSPEAPGGPGPLVEALNLLETLTFSSDGPAGSAGPSVPAEEASWFGLIGYDAARDFERLPAYRSVGVPVYDLFLPEILVRFEADHTVVIGRGDTRAGARTAATAAMRALARAGEPTLRPARLATAEASLTRAGHEDAVRRAKRYIVDGDIFQVVLSVAWRAAGRADALEIYQRLAEANPARLQFWFHGGDYATAGSSPEPCVLVHDGRAVIRTLAGTAPRGTHRLADVRAERRLRTSEKDLAEHRMLVDLARNDLGRICRPGTVEVPELFAVERYSHVMHLVSAVTGLLRDDVRMAEVVRATFPAGTMTGAPKVRAMEIIDELEPVGRGPYSGAVGWFGLRHAGLYLNIRGSVVAQDQVTLQAGGGIVYDSDPAAEYAECLAKLAATARVLGVEPPLAGLDLPVAVR